MEPPLEHTALARPLDVPEHRPAHHARRLERIGLAVEVLEQGRAVLRAPAGATRVGECPVDDRAMEAVEHGVQPRAAPGRVDPQLLVDVAQRLHVQHVPEEVGERARGPGLEAAG